MTDGRNFEWPEAAVNVAREMTFRYATVDEVMQFLLPYVKDALAAEYSRGYETAWDTEVQPGKAIAWERGVAEGIRYGQASVQTSTYYDESRIKKPVNPYIV